MQQEDPRWQGQPAWPAHPGPGGGFPPQRRNRGLIIGVVIGCVVLLVAAGGILLVAGRDLVRLVVPDVSANRGPAEAAGTASIGNGVTVTVPVGWAVKSSEPDSAVLTRDPGRGQFFGRTSTGQTMPPAELCGDYRSSMAQRGMVLHCGH